MCERGGALGNGRTPWYAPASSMRLRYFDTAASTPVDRRVLRAMRPFWQENFGNPSSVHRAGVRAHAALEEARATVARELGVAPAAVTWVSGATEGNNAVVRSALRPGDHAVTLATEHPATLATLAAIGAEVTAVAVAPDGTVRPEDVAAAITPHTRLLTFAHANQETGVLFPVAEIARAARRKHRDLLIHIDCAQTIGALTFTLDDLHADAVTFGAQKIYGPKGIGCMVTRPGCTLTPLVTGGGQENGRRAGTQNVPGAVGLATALTLARADALREQARQAALRDALFSQLQKSCPSVVRNGNAAATLPNFLNIAFPGIDGEELLFRLDAQGICVATAAACERGEESRVLRAMGLPDEIVRGSIRITLGRMTTRGDIRVLARVLPRALATCTMRAV